MSAPPSIEAAIRAQLETTLGVAAATTTHDETSLELGPLVRLVRTLRRIGPRRADALRALGTVLGEALPRERSHALVARVLRGVRARGGLADHGLLPAHGLFSELRERLIGKLLPSHLPPHDLREVLATVFDPSDARWLAELDDAVLAELLDTLTPDDALAREHLVLEVLRAIELLAHRIASAGEDPGLVAFDPASIDHESPFLAQAGVVVALTTRLEASLRGEPSPSEEDHAEVRVLLGQCGDHLARLARRAPQTGATLRMTYEVERTRDLIDRLTLLLGTLDPRPGEARRARVRLLRALVEAQADAERVWPVFVRGSHLVAKEIASRAGRTGEHYITRTASEWGWMWRAAAGAGLVVAVMACLKVGIASLEAPPLLEASLFSVNYAAGFSLVGLLGFTIATKQPAMTAAALAQSVEPGKSRGPERHAALVETIQSLIRGQLAAILANCLVALPAAWLLSMAHSAIAGQPIAGVEKARHLVHDLDPLTSLAWPHAALTGVWLTLSGIVAGYVASAVVARHVPTRLTRSSALSSAFGRERVRRLADGVAANAGPIAGSIVLGVLLGSTGTVGALLGLPIDIRHVSFASANLGLSLHTLGTEVEVSRVLIGIAGIGVLNLAVSFGLSLSLALHATGRSRAELGSLARALGWALVIAPWAWVLPLGSRARLTGSTASA